MNTPLSNHGFAAADPWFVKFSLKRFQSLDKGVLSLYNQLIKYVNERGTYDKTKSPCKSSF